MARKNTIITSRSGVVSLLCRVDWTRDDSGGTLFPGRLEGNIRTFAGKSLQSVVSLLIDVEMV